MKSLAERNPELKDVVDRADFIQFTMSTENFEILSTVDKKFELEWKRKEKFEKIKKGLMSDLLTGKKRIKLEV